MPKIGSKVVSARVENELADDFAKIATMRGYTTAGFLTQLMREQTAEVVVDPAYDAAFQLVDELAENGHDPVKVINDFRKKITPYNRSDWA